ncbi:hypothetical protein DPMN_044040 [Dreissena polymorpha]|uniref:Uncharacterized protein n=1 Tax=Dreissena polymorpha TaxID=45954 RepID=A0A9D4D282_DREPO|nr:hypothetical protein DPMN_044040 [Dreissena polymorpha]
MIGQKLKTAPPTWGHVFQRIGTTFKLNQDIRLIFVFLFFTYFELGQDFIGTKLLTKFHEDGTINVASRVFTSKYGHTTDKKPVTKAHLSNQQTSIFKDGIAGLGLSISHVIQLTGTIFELNSRIKETNVLTKFNENWAKNVTSRVFTCFHYIHIDKNAPPTGDHDFSPIWTIFELVQDINKSTA